MKRGQAKVWGAFYLAAVTSCLTGCANEEIPADPCEIEGQLVHWKGLVTYNIAYSSSHVSPPYFARYRPYPSRPLNPDFVNPDLDEIALNFDWNETYTAKFGEEFDPIRENLGDRDVGSIEIFGDWTGNVGVAGGDCYLPDSDNRVFQITSGTSLRFSRRDTF